jgi:molybdopterin converting factor small subunit
VRVSVRYMAQLRLAAGMAVEPVELDRPCSMGELLTHLAQRHGSPFRDLLVDAGGAPHAGVLLFVGAEQVDLEQATLRDGDVVTVLTPMAGG